MCLWCNTRGRGFRSVDAAQKHMVDKGHCKLLHEGDVQLEYADFYDYRYGLLWYCHFILEEVIP